MVDFKVVGIYSIWARFDDGIEQIIDLEPILQGEMWGQLHDPHYFRRVKLDSIVCALSWPNGADFDPETLRNWPNYKDELAQRAQRAVLAFA